MASAFNAQSDPDVVFKSFSASQQSDVYKRQSQMAVVFILELIGRELKGVHNDTDCLLYTSRCV